ncbi:MAG: hypothetical protein WBS54_06230 [Acidobacteriota bacterium]
MKRSVRSFVLLLMVAVLALSCGRHHAPASTQRPPRTQGPAPAAKSETAVPAIPSQPPSESRADELTANARLLAGLPVEGPGPWAAIQERPSWQAHAKAMGSLWKQDDAARLSKVRAFAQARLSHLNDAAPTVFYPFGGPDALYPTALFPKAATYVLVGLEPVGRPPELASLSQPELEASLKAMQEYITPILQISFFRTDDMEQELQNKGVLPILLVFLAGTGHRIWDVEPMAVSPDGALAPSSWEEKPRAVRVDFSAGDARERQTLLYFSQDLSDAGLKKRPGFEAYLATLGSPVTFLKAASYLMYEPWFSRIRAAILDRSSAVLEDDSGLPLKAFHANEWNLTFFGTYTGPIHRFKNCLQPDLQEAYAEGPALPLPFGIGYQHIAGHSNLMLAIRKR